MLPQTLLRASAHLEGDQIVPHYFSARDEPWLRRVMDEYRHFVGRRRSELHEQLRKPLAAPPPKTKLRIAMLVLDALCRARPAAAVPPKQARAALFRAAAANSRASRSELLGSVAAALAVTAAELERALFADLRSDLCVAQLPPDLCPAQVATEANLAIVTSLIRRAAHVRILVPGNSRRLVRQARVAGLICRESRPERAAEGIVLDVSGPFSLFRHSDIYGRALASLIPRLRSGDEFELTASCALGSTGHLPSLVVRSGDPIGLDTESSALESRIERRFERDFRSAAPDWQLISEPSVIAAGMTLIFPNFELVPRQDPSRSWLLEIVGFWTGEYLHEKLRRLHAAGSERFVLCIDQNRACADGALPQDSRIIRYKTRIDPRAVLALITRESAE